VSLNFEPSKIMVAYQTINKFNFQCSSSFELDVVLYSVSVISLQHKSCSVYMSFVRLGHHNG